MRTGEHQMRTIMYYSSRSLLHVIVTTVGGGLSSLFVISLWVNTADPAAASNPVGIIIGSVLGALFGTLFATPVLIVASIITIPVWACSPKVNLFFEVIVWCFLSSIMCAFVGFFWANFNPPAILLVAGAFAGLFTWPFLSLIWNRFE